MAATTLPWTPDPCSGKRTTIHLLPRNVVPLNRIPRNAETHNYQLCLYIKIYRKIHFRKTGENTFVPLSDQELARLSNVEMPESIEIGQSDNDDPDDRSDSDSDRGWETTEEVDDGGDVNGQANDG